VTPAVEPRVLRRPLALPSAAEHALLLLAGWSTTGRVGVYERGGAAGVVEPRGGGRSE